MADINKRLLTSSDGIPAPQHKVKGESDFEFTEGSGGAQHTKIVDSSGQPISIDDELKSIKRTQAEILDRLDNGIDTRLTGSNVEDAFPANLKGKYKLETLVNSVTVGAGGSVGNTYLRPTDEMEIYLFISIDVHPWELRWRNQFGSVSSVNGFPDYANETKAYGNNTPAISIPLGYRPGAQGLPAPANLEEAKKWRLPLTPSEYFNVFNRSDSPATIKVDVLRVWR